MPTTKVIIEWDTPEEELEFLDMVNAMDDYGGSFVKALAMALRLADRQNKAKLLEAFPEYVTEHKEKSKWKKGKK